MAGLPAVAPGPGLSEGVCGMTGAEGGLAACLAAIGAREAAVRAWTHVDRAAAPSVDGPLAGLAVGVKDIVDVAGMPCERGSPIYAGRVPTRDAACVARLREAGAAVLGKTVTTEFAAFAPPVTSNPHDAARTPGGSSSGSAAAVACGMADIALGTQTAGSVIRPAAYCGVAGFKPTFGAVALDGVKALAPSLDTLGWFARAADGLATAAAAFGIAEAPAGPPPRVALCRGPEWRRLDAATRAMLGRALAAFAAAGAETGERATAPPFDGLNEAQEVIMKAEAARSLAHERAEHGERLSDGLREMLDIGARLAPDALDRARDCAAECRAGEAALFGGADLLLTAAAPGEAPPRATTGDPMCNRAWTLLGAPCATLPFGAGPNGLPLGAQLVARRGADPRLLAWARWAEGALADAGRPETGA